ncbi:LysR family transcriptional regulator [Advenella kashmirensis]|uniref:LysR family transcriptional regulator n=1 Tax=Advenella kashmirensis TaxID=310575 RepID=UPI001EE658AC|nr:LysR family transcriptional regulator [Advenella kashmirensis]
MKVTNLDLTLLRTFVAVAEGDSFARAAQSVFKSQAAISQQMQRLELQLGCDLFIKSGRSKRLTDQASGFWSMQGLY